MEALVGTAQPLKTSHLDRPQAETIPILREPVAAPRSVIEQRLSAHENVRHPIEEGLVRLFQIASDGSIRRDERLVQ